MPSEVVSESTVSIHAITDVGRSRSHNEDNFIVCPDLKEKRWYFSDKPAQLSAKGCLLVVADGMGGANAGEVASEIAVETVKQKFNSLDLGTDIDEHQARNYLYQAILEAHKAIVAASGENPEYAGMGTTVLVAWIFSQKAVIGWCGDSRGYLYRKKKGLKILTKDHSLVWELVEAGKLTPDEADTHPNSNIITQSLGDEKYTPKPDFVVCPLEEGDRLLFCSDGLNNMVRHKEIEEILSNEGPLADINQMLVQLANQQGGVDNITVVGLEVVKSFSKNSFFKTFWSMIGLVTFFLFCYPLFF